LRNGSLLVILEQIILYGPRGNFELWYDMPAHALTQNAHSLSLSLSLFLSSILEVAMIANISIIALLLQKFFIAG
jgi:hypothetical protein